MIALKKYREYSKHTDKPLLIYLHGAGEKGTDTTIATRDKLLNKKPQK